MALTGAYPALFRDDHRHRLFHLLRFHRRLLGGFDQRAAVVAIGLDVGLDFPDDRLLQRGFAAQQALQLFPLVFQRLQFLLDADGLQPGQLAQADFQNVLGLPFGQPERLHQRRSGLIRFADDADHLVDVQQHQLPAFQDVDAVLHLAQPVCTAATHRVQPEIDPFLQDVGQCLLARAPVPPQHHQVDRHRGFQAGAGQQGVHQQRLFDLRGTRLEHQAHRRLAAALVTHRVHHVQDLLLCLQLLGRQRLLAGAHLRIAEFLDLFQHLLGGHAVRQLVDDQLPLAARQLLDVPARPHTDGATATAIGLAQVGAAADDLPAPRKIRPGQDVHQRLVRELRVADQRNGRMGHFHQVVRRNLRGHGHGNARRPVEQDHR